ncbi:Tensin-4 [Nymphon striatum]|nr:Tensin-4 [Nymphon striatum]
MITSIKDLSCKYRLKEVDFPPIQHHLKRGDMIHALQYLKWNRPAGPKQHTQKGHPGQNKGTLPKAKLLSKVQVGLEIVVLYCSYRMTLMDDVTYVRIPYTSEKAEDLNSIVGNAFRLAFAKQIDRDRDLPSFNSLVDQQIQHNKLLSETTTSTDKTGNSNDLYQTSSECSEEIYGQRINDSQTNAIQKSKPHVKHKFTPFKRLWAKNNKVQHKEPVLDRITEMSGLPLGNSRFGIQKSKEMTVFQFEDNSRQKTNFECDQSMPPTPPNSLRLCSPRNGSLAGSSSPSPSDSVSSDDNNVSSLYNNFNSAELDKLPMVKKVSVLCDKVVGLSESDKKQEDPDLLACSVVRNRTVAHCSRSPVIPVSQPTYNQPTIFDSTNSSNLNGKESSGSSENMLISFEDVKKKACDSNNDQEKTPNRSVTDLGKAVRQGKLPSSNKSPITIKEKKIRRDSNNLIHNNEINNMKRGNRCDTKYNSVGIPPPLPQRYDSLSMEGQYDENELKKAPWFQAGIPREIALEILSKEPVGAFMVRESTTRPDCFALSLRVPIQFQPTGISHYLILNTNKGYKIKGFTKEFSTLTSLITHHSVMPELLPCTLSLSRYNANFSQNDSRSSDDADDDPDYETLSDFRKVMSDLNV